MLVSKDINLRATPAVGVNAEDDDSDKQIIDKIV